MDNYFSENEMKANKLILRINWVPIIILGLAKLSLIIYAIHSKDKMILLSLAILILLSLVAEVICSYGFKNKRCFKSLKYYTILLLELTACLLIISMGEFFALCLCFYPLIAAAIYHDKKLILYSVVLNLAALFIMVNYRLINIVAPQYQIELLGELLAIFILCIFILAGNIKQFADVIKTLDRQDVELEETNKKFEVSNIELQNKKEHLKSLNESLELSNSELERALDELQRTQKNLVQHEKIASVGQLSAGVAHEINTPIGAIKSNIDISKQLILELKKQFMIYPSQEGEGLLHKLEIIADTNMQACTRIDKTLKSLKNFARGDNDELQQLDVNGIIDNVLILLKSRIGTKVEIVKEFGEIPKIECFSGQLNHAIMNLIENAIDAVNDSGTIWISTGVVEENKIFIKIKDNGIGIDEANFKNIFDPGFSTKGDRVGAGFGLATVYKIVENHHGSLKFDSELHKGTEFIAILPIRFEK